MSVCVVFGCYVDQEEVHDLPFGIIKGDYMNLKVCRDHCYGLVRILLFRL